jgi:hypothetical protein
MRLWSSLSRSLCFLALFLLQTDSSEALAATACTQTLSPGASVASAISSAAAGSVLCLASGSFGQVNLTNVSKTSPVTVRSVTGKEATLSLDLSGVNQLRFESLTLSGLDITGVSRNLVVSSNKFTGQALVRSDTSNANILLDGNSFDGISVCANCYEGRLQLWSPDGLPSGVTVSNNHFGGAGESDGIQIGGYGLVIGPGNVFDGIVQGNYGRHVDAIQLYGQSHTTITGNYFVNNDVQIMAPDGGDTEIITHNVFVGGGYGPSIQLGTHLNDTFAHNTVIGVSVHIDKKMENTTKSSNAVAINNIMIGSEFSTIDSGGVQSCANCTFDHNLFTVSSDAMGTNNLIGTPTFVGGASPTTWRGYQLQPTSLGVRAATDGKDMGIVVVSSPGTLAAPTRLRVVP